MTCSRNTERVLLLKHVFRVGGGGGGGINEIVSYSKEFFYLY